MFNEESYFKNLTPEELERQKQAIEELPAYAGRDELLRLNSFYRAALEASGCANVHDLIDFLPGLRALRAARAEDAKRRRADDERRRNQN